MEMKELEMVKKELKDLRIVIDVHKELLRKFPNDGIVKFSLEQYLFRERELLRELKRYKKVELNNGK